MGKYCDGLDCEICGEKEPCIYKIANKLEEENKKLRKKYGELEINYDGKLDVIDGKNEKIKKLELKLEKIKKLLNGNFSYYKLKYEIIQIIEGYRK